MKRGIGYFLALFVLSVGLLMVRAYAGAPVPKDQVIISDTAGLTPPPTFVNTGWVITDYFDYGVQSVTSTSAVIAVGYEAELKTLGPGEPTVDYLFGLRYWEAGSTETHVVDPYILLSFPKRIEKTLLNLKPNTKYFYQFHNEPVNSFTTLASDLKGLVDFNIQNYYGGSTTTVIIKNLSSIALKNWKLKWVFNESAQITQLWSGSLLQTGANVEVTPLAWNNEIAPGASLVLGFNANNQLTKPLALELQTENGKVELAASATDMASLVNANSQFAFALFQQLTANETGKNVFISPLSVSTAIAMLYQGANGDTRDEIAKTLGYYGIDINRLNWDYQTLLRNLNNLDPKVTLKIANSIWYRNPLNVQPQFITTNQEVFQAETKGLDFANPEAAATINQWISTATNGMIDHMVDPPLVDKMILANALYFKSPWTKAFNGKLTHKALFITESGNANTVDMMQSYETTEFGKGTDYSAIRIPYSNKKISMYCILPAAGQSINSLISVLNVDKFTAIKKSLSARASFNVQLPRFKMGYGVASLKNALNSLGMKKAFSADAEFSGISSDLDGISDVLHKAVIDVNEAGTEAAAVTVIASPGVPQDSFSAYRPFVFIIVDDTTGSILFMGKAANLVEYYSGN